MNRLMEYTVFSGFVTACRFATCPTSRSPVFVMATTDGVVRAPSWLGITTGSPPCNTATTEFVVPSSKGSIHVECMLVKFSDNICNAVRFSHLWHLVRPSKLRQI